MKKQNKKQKLISGIAIIIVAIILAIIITTNIINNSIGSKAHLSANSNAHSNLIANYIKKGITIGGITGTLETLNTFDATATPEDIVYGKTAYVKGEKITGTKITREILKIGDYVEYTPDVASSYSLTSAASGHSSNQTINQESFKWRILSVNKDGTVNLISDKTTEQDLYLGGSLGYNNGVLILNDICSKLYGNKELNVTARSLKLEDIENKLSEEGYEFRNQNVLYNIKYGETYKPNDTNATYYPYLYAKENGSGVNTDTIKTDGIGQSDSYYTSPTTETGTWATSLTATQTNYSLRILSENFIDENFANVISSDKVFWLASRSANCYGDENDVIGFKIFIIMGINSDGSTLGYNIMQGSDLVTSNGSSTAFTDLGYRIRPIVTLNSNIEFTSGEGTMEKPYKISK